MLALLLSRLWLSFLFFRQSMPCSKREFASGQFQSGSSSSPPRLNRTWDFGPSIFAFRCPAVVNWWSFHWSRDRRVGAFDGNNSNTPTRALLLARARTHACARACFSGEAAHRGVHRCAVSAVGVGVGQPRGLRAVPRGPPGGRQDVSGTLHRRRPQQKVRSSTSCTIHVHALNAPGVFLVPLSFCAK